MKNSPDVATALNEFVLNFDLHDRGATLFLKEEDGTCLLVYEIYQHGIEAVEQIVDGAMAVGLQWHYLKRNAYLINEVDWAEHLSALSCGYRIHDE
jgi:hypothetical protein